ncbi:hypothetical protein [Rhizobium sp. YS-1r]|uniref:hypothetical protein n=1 Tax=Rhizobium sp. YS-1r TaxID=1532558 RepID=UPI00050F33DE|nr:hypothetical protein [Rhizobium sp. YS-1r]KGE01635.1 hypothetical protein JL39_04510 [Rhizobium sp. YS-1r]
MKLKKILKNIGFSKRPPKKTTSSTTTPVPKPPAVPVINIWKNDAIKLSFDSKTSEWWRNTLLIQRRTPISDAEDNLYQAIIKSKSSAFSPDRLYRVLVDDAPSSLTVAGTDDLTRNIERMIIATKQTMSKFGCIIAVDPDNSLPWAMRESTADVRLIVVETPGQSKELDIHTLANADIIVTYKEPADDVIAYSARRIDVAPTPDALFPTLEAAVIDLYPKEFNVLLPIYNCWERLPEMEAVDTSRTDIVLWLTCSEDAAPCVSETFRQFVADLAPKVHRIAATDQARNRYLNLIDRLGAPQGVAYFLERAFQDGARVEVYYA